MTSTPGEPDLEPDVERPMPTPDPTEVEQDIPGVDPDWPQTPQQNEPVERLAV
jgi:hypothetical protein